jgi:hypothetical protein
MGEDVNSSEGVRRISEFSKGVRSAQAVDVVVLIQRQDTGVNPMHSVMQLQTE